MINGLEIAKLIASFLNRTIKKDGNFEQLYSCRRDFCTSIKPLKPRSDGPIIVFYWELFEKTKNPLYKDKADKAVEYWLNRCEIEGGPINCGQNFNPFSVYYKVTKDKKYLDVLTKFGEVFFEDIPVKELTDTKYGFKLEILYNLTHDQKYKKRLEELTNRLLNSPTLPFVKHYLLPAYRVTGKDIYLKVAKEILKKTKASNQLSQMSLFLEGLLEADELPEAKKLAQILVSDFWDTTERKIFNGDFGFVDSSDKKRTGTKTTTLIAEVGQGFIRMADMKFSMGTV